MKTRVLLVDDNVEFCNNVSEYLSIRGNYECTIVTSPRNVIQELKSRKYDIITLDIEMGEYFGVDMLPSIKEIYSGPIILISCLYDADTKISGLRNGADDYLVKPILMEELYIRIEKLINRINTKSYIKLGRYVFDEAKQVVYMKEKRLDLNVNHYKMLLYMVQNPGELLTREKISMIGWNNSIFESRIVDTAISKIRKETKDYHIITIRGQGYMYEKEE